MLSAIPIVVKITIFKSFFDFLSSSTFASILPSVSISCICSFMIVLYCFEIAAYKKKYDINASNNNNL